MLSAAQWPAPKRRPMGTISAHGGNMVSRLVGKVSANISTLLLRKAILKQPRGHPGRDGRVGISGDCPGSRVSRGISRCRPCEFPATRHNNIPASRNLNHPPRSSAGIGHRACDRMPDRLPRGGVVDKPYTPCSLPLKAVSYNHLSKIFF